MLHLSISVKNISFCAREGPRALNQVIDNSRIRPPISGGGLFLLREFVTISDRRRLRKPSGPPSFLIAQAQAVPPPCGRR